MHNSKIFKKNKRILLTITFSFISFIFYSVRLYSEIPKNQKKSLLNVLEKEQKDDKKNYLNKEYLESALLVQKAISKIAKSSLDAVVSIKGVRVSKRDNYKLFNDFFKFFQPYPRKNLPNRSIPKMEVTMGSGFIIDKNGFVITNNHVIDGSKDIKVTLQNNDQYKGTLIFKSEDIDMALLKIDSDRKNFSSIELGNSDNVNIGDFTIAVGNPFGSLSGTYTFGIVSSKARDISNVSLDYSNNYNNYIQTDAAINIGNSGGPLLNIKGQVIGINTLIYSPNGAGFSGIGFAIPINFVKTILASLVKTGSFKTSHLGVIVNDLNESIIEYFNLKSKNGCMIQSIQKNSPSWNILKEGDIILEFDNKPIQTCNSLRLYIVYSSNKKDHLLKIFRNSKILNVKVRLMEKKSVSIKKSVNKEKNSSYEFSNFLNMKLGNINDFRSKFSYLNKGLEGLVVLSINNNSKYLYSRNISIGDVIQEVNFTKIKNLNDINNFVKNNTKNNKSFILKVKSFISNQFMTNFVVVKLQEK